MIIKCIKSVVMLCSGLPTFTEGRLYEAIVTEIGINVQNDQGGPHWVNVNTEGATHNWAWFAKHFA